MSEATYSSRLGSQGSEHKELPQSVRILVVMPTYNERENLPELFRAIRTNLPQADLLIIDDNSPDGTGEVADQLAAQYPGIYVIHRSGKLGLGTAYLLGFKNAIQNHYDLVFEMDADFSHDPTYLEEFVRTAMSSDAPGLVIGSRYVDGGATPDWSFTRKAISGWGNRFAQLILGLPIHDATSGYRCYRTAALQYLNLPAVQSQGYAFQVEMAYATWKSGFAVAEVPIVFMDRRVGQSKMSRAIFVEAFVWVLRTRLQGSQVVNTDPALSLPPLIEQSASKRSGANAKQNGLVHPPLSKNSTEDARTQPLPLQSKLSLLHMGMLIAMIAYVFWPAVTAFFLGDDFGWIGRTQDSLNTPSAWLAVFTKSNYAHTYRPLSQQVFFWAGERMFGLNPLGYHLIVFATFLGSAIALYWLIFRLTSSQWIAFGSSIIWALSTTHLDSLNWVSAFTETSTVLFLVLAMLAIVRGQAGWAALWYAGTLLCDESAIVLPALAFAYLLIVKRESVVSIVRHTASLWVVFLAYVPLRLFVLGFQASASHAVVLSSSVIKTLTLTSLYWSFGKVPSYGAIRTSSTAFWSNTVHNLLALSLALWLLLLVLMVVQALRHKWDSDGLRLAVFGAVWYPIAFLPILLFTANSFVPYNLSVPLLSLSLMCAGLAKSVKGWGISASIAFAAVYFLLNAATMYAPGGALQNDFLFLLSRAAERVYVQMEAAEQTHPGPLHITVLTDSESALFYGEWALYWSDSANLVAPGSSVCYMQTSPSTQPSPYPEYTQSSQSCPPANVEFQLDTTTWTYRVVHVAP